VRDAPSRAERDWARRRIGLLLWSPPWVAILASGLGAVAPVSRGSIGALALLWAGAACITNACRSGRLQCYITGPFFVILGGASLLYGAGILPLGARGWLWIGGVLIAGTTGRSMTPNAKRSAPHPVHVSGVPQDPLRRERSARVAERFLCRVTTDPLRRDTLDDVKTRSGARRIRVYGQISISGSCLNVPRRTEYL
jgi:hypothetical protein